MIEYILSSFNEGNNIFVGLKHQLKLAFDLDDPFNNGEWLTYISFAQKEFGVVAPTPPLILMAKGYTHRAHVCYFALTTHLYKKKTFSLLGIRHGHSYRVWDLGQNSMHGLVRVYPLSASFQPKRSQ